MIKRGKYYLPPPNDGSDFKELFKQLVSTGAGRPVDEGGFPLGPWSPELLAEAISNIEANQAGIDLRTVQHWFQENDKGISADNIRWLARIFGCGDPDASGAWQSELSAANRRLVAARKAKRKAGKRELQPSSVEAQTVDTIAPAGTVRNIIAKERIKRFSLARRSEALFSNQSSKGLPIVVFAAATALALISFTMKFHSVVFTPFSGPAKQVGFLWAPNWTIVFLLVLPMYLAFLIDLLRCWKEEWRTQLVAFRDPALPMPSWDSRVAAASYSYWAALIVTVVIASGYNWTATHLVPLLTGDAGSWPVDWGRIEPRRVCWRLICLSYAAMSDLSRVA